MYLLIAEERPCHAYRTENKNNNSEHRAHTSKQLFSSYHMAVASVQDGCM